MTMCVILLVAIIGVVVPSDRCEGQEESSQYPFFWGIDIDGSAADWPSLSLAESSLPPTNSSPANVLRLNWRYGRSFHDVAEMNASIQNPIRFYTSGGAYYFVSKPHPETVLVFAFMFGSLPFSGEEITYYELYFDVLPLDRKGCPDTPWRDFLPDHRFVMQGNNQRLVSKVHQVWGHDAWSTLSEDDSAQFSVAAGEVLECMVKWTNIGGPLERPLDSYLNDPLFGWAFRSWQGKVEDQLLPEVLPTSVFFMNNHSVETEVEEMAWAKVKASPAVPTLKP